MRTRKSFRPTSLDGLETRLAPSAIVAVPTEVAKVADHHDHASKADHPMNHEGGHEDHQTHVKK